MAYLRLKGDYGSGKTRAFIGLGSVAYKGFFGSGASTVSPTLGAQVRKGEYGSLIVFYKGLEEETTEDEDHTENRLSFVARASYVSNAEQMDGFAPPDVEHPDPSQVHQQAETMLDVAMLKDLNSKKW